MSVNFILATTAIAIAAFAVAAATAATTSAPAIQLFRFRVAHINYLSFEMQIGTSQRMIEVHFHSLVS